jgi:hypothetical protein
MKLNQTYLNLGLLLALGGLAACAQQPAYDASACRLSDTSNVDRLFAEAAEKLRDDSCHYSFPEYRERLIATAKGAPGAENEARFAGLIRQGIDLGIISQRQGQETFSRYFDPEFYVVKDEARSSCSSLRSKDELYAAMRGELEDKREGMLEILDDEARFRRAQHYYNDLSLVFDAVDAACTRGG